MATSIGYLPPSEDHPHDVNIYKFVYVALIVYMIICFIGPLTGCHINPAVTIGLNLGKINKKGQIKLLLTYWIAQFLGGFVGVVLSRSIYGNGGAAFQ